MDDDLHFIEEAQETTGGWDGRSGDVSNSLAAFALEKLLGMPAAYVFPGNQRSAEEVLAGLVGCNHGGQHHGNRPCPPAHRWPDGDFAGFHRDGVLAHWKDW
jgi:hypothetical protein